MKPSLLRLFAVLLTFGCAGSRAAATPPEVPAKGYLFAYFLDNGQDGLHLAWSADGLKWAALKNGGSFLTPQVGNSKLMRDPCVTQGPDGVFQMVWTDSWEGTTIGYASSKDLITWSEQKALPVMAHEPTVKNCWAPEILYDAKWKRFLIFWASTVPGKFPATELAGKNDNNHRIYATTTSDFTGFSPTKLFFDPGFNCIDATVMPYEGKSVMIFKDETKVPTAMKNLRMATATTLTGHYEVITEPLNPPGSWVEGPTTLKVGKEVIVYFDAYTKHHYAALASSDLKHWRDVTQELVMPKGIRHGTAFEVSGAVLRKLLEL